MTVSSGAETSNSTALDTDGNLSHNYAKEEDDTMMGEGQLRVEDDDDALAVTMVAVEYCMHSDGDGGGVAGSDNGGGSGADYSESSSSGSSNVTGGSSSGDSSESTAATGGVSEDAVDPHLLPSISTDEGEVVVSKEKTPPCDAQHDDPLDGENSLPLEDMSHPMV